MKSYYYDILKDLLLAKKDFTTTEGTLNLSKIQNDAFNATDDLISLLMQNEAIKKLFFIKKNDVLIYQRDSFLDFISKKDFLANSYTNFSNKIGLAVGNRFFKQNTEVVLNFPFKDCVLEGGQTKDDKKQQELFFNETLAVDEIDRLLSPKVLSNAKRFNKDGEQKLTKFNRDSSGLIKDNLIIKGNNLLALHTIKTQFQGKVKLIYIDPPYNTGNDSFNYNDNFNHSTWLTFMKNRLEVAKDLLRDDGVIFVQCDDNEQAYLKVLMDEIFGRENFLNCIAIKMSTSAGLKMSHKNKRLLKIKEYILVFTKNCNKFRLESIDVLYVDRNGYETERSDKYIENIEKDYSNWYFSSLHEAYKKYSKNGEMKFEFVNRNYQRIFNHVINKSTKKAWEKLSSSEKIIFKDKVRKYNVEKSNYNFAYNDHVLIPYNPKILDGDMWNRNYSIGGTKTQEGGVEFSNGKKKENLLQRLVEISTQKGDLVLDYHLGSGTTCAVAHKMGRQYIGIEQMDYIEDIAVTRMQKVIDGEQGGISKSVNWTGGGEFVYCELKQNSDKLIQKITNAKTTNELLAIKQSIKNYTFVDYRINLEILKNDKQADKDFKQLEFKDQQQILISIFDKNQMYVNYSERDDSLFKVSKDETAISKDFYEKKIKWI